MGAAKTAPLVFCLPDCELGCVRAGRAFATVYRVGPDEALKTPSQAARIVRSGDTVQIEPMPGGYYDCAIWRADDLTIEGIGNDVRLTDMTCQGKAIFVITGKHITIRNLTFARARVPDWNGAGIRAEGEDLRVEHSRFINNESGIFRGQFGEQSNHHKRQPVHRQRHLWARSLRRCDRGGPHRPPDRSSIAISRTRKAAMRSALWRRIHVSSPTISKTARRARPRTSSNCRPAARSKWRTMCSERGPLPSDPSVAIRVMEGAGAHTVKTLAFSGNTLRNDTHAPLTFVLNWTGTTARMENNHLPQDVTPVSSSGYLWFLAKSSIHRSLAAAKALARAIRHHL